MIKRDVLFNLRRLGDNPELCSGIVTDVIGYHNNSGYPCIYNRNRIKLFDELDVILPMGILENPRPMMSHRVMRESIIHKDNKTIADSKIKLIEKFDFDKTRKISEYVKNHRALALYFMAHSAYGAAIPTGRNVMKFIDRLGIIINNYRYYSMSYLYYSKDKVTYPKGDLRYIIYFINMPNCVPILNRYKVDGMCVIFQIVSLSDVLSTNTMTPVFNIATILSNYRENIFVIDGINVRDQRPINNEALLIAKNTIAKSIKSKDTFLLREKAESEKKIKNGYITHTAQWADVRAVNTYATLDASSTATYYYNSTSS